MAVTLIITTAAGAQETLELDASPQQDFSSSVQLTEHPTESGARMVDHQVDNPDQVTVQGIISNTPTGSRAGAGSSAPGAPGRAEAAWARLLLAKTNADTFTVVTPLQTHAQMRLQDVKATRTAKLGDALAFTATFKRVLVQSTQTVQLRVLEPRGKPKVQLGRQVAKPADEATVRKSTLKKAKDWFTKKYLSEGEG